MATPYSKFLPTFGHLHPKKVARKRLLLGALLVFVAVCIITAIYDTGFNFQSRTIATLVILLLALCGVAILYGICCIFSGVNIFIKNYLGTL